MSLAYEHFGPWSVGDVLALDEDRRYRHELLDGALMMSPAPGVVHQRASRRLAEILDAAARAADAPVEVLEAVNVTVPSGLLIPDIVLVDVAATRGGPVTLDAASVLLVVEIVSASTRHMDRKMKPVLYAEAGIDFYWRLELEPAPTLMVADRIGDRYTVPATVPAGTVTRLNSPFPIEVDPVALTRP